MEFTRICEFENVVKDQTKILKKAIVYTKVDLNKKGDFSIYSMYEFEFWLTIQVNIM